MVKITYNPVKELVVTEVIKYDNVAEWEEMLLPVLRSGQQVMLRWANGVLFNYNSYPVSETTMKDRLEGILYIDAVFYAFMPTYQPHKTLEPPGGGTFTYGITDVSRTSNLVELVKWIKEYDKSKK